MSARARLDSKAQELDPSQPSGLKSGSRLPPLKGTAIIAIAQFVCMCVCAFAALQAESGELADFCAPSVSSLAKAGRASERASKLAGEQIANSS